MVKRRPLNLCVQARTWILLQALLFGLLCARPILANGGVLQIARAPAGPYDITVFTSPNPLRVGPIDVSLLVQRHGSDDLVEGIQALVTITPLGHAGPGGAFPATRAQATNKLFYAAKFRLPRAGRWRISTGVVGPQGSGSAAFEIEAGEAQLIDPVALWLLLAVVPVALGIWRTHGRTRLVMERRSRKHE
jgi:hypothetical protein